MDRFLTTVSLPKAKTRSSREQVSQAQRLVSRHAMGSKPEPATIAKTPISRVPHRTQSGIPKQEAIGASDIEAYKSQLEQNSEIISYKKSVKDFENYIVRLENENTMLSNGLRLCFAGVTLELSVVHSDAHYKESLEELNYLICASVAKLCTMDRSKQSGWSHESLREILQTVEGGATDIKRESSQFVSKLSLSLHKDPKRVIAFTRYLISLFLYTHVFSLFAFGLDSIESANMIEIEDHLLARGTGSSVTWFTVDSDLSEVVSVRHSINRAISYQLRHSGRPAITQAKLVDVLERTLFHLYPRATELRQMASEILTLAITTQVEMTAELGLFLCKWVERGSDPGSERAKVVDESQKGKIMLCTFPGFWKRIREDGKESWIPIVFPRVELESAFR